MDDFLLPDDKTIDLMNKAYANSNVKNASIFAYSATPLCDARPFAHASFIQTVFLCLYITSILR